MGPKMAMGRAQAAFLGVISISFSRHVFGAFFCEPEHRAVRDDGHDIDGNDML